MWTQMQTPGLGNLLAYLVEMNITLALFNLLPAFPMDGGRILRSILATAMPYIQATRFSVFVGRIIAVILAIWGLTGGGVLLLLIAFFIYVGGGSEQESIESRAILRDIPIAQALTPGAISLYTSERAKRAVDLIMTSYQTDYPVLDLAGQFVGVLTRARLILALREVGEEARIVEIMTPAESVPNFSLDGTLSDIWEKMVQSGSRVVAVREGNQFRGLITIDDVTELIQVMGANFDRNLQKPPSSSASNNQPSPASGETANA
jgi:stage IV sporulation protein FB